MKTILTTYFKLSLFFIPILFTNCSKDEEGVSAEAKETILISNTWKINEVITHTHYEFDVLGKKQSGDTIINALAEIPECQYDIDINFLESGILQHTATDLYCGEDLEGNLSWDLSTSGNELTIVSDEGTLFFLNSTGLVAKEEMELKILTLTENTLMCRFTLPVEEALGMYSEEFDLDLMEAMGIEISGYMNVDYTFVIK
jgi:hypothetical protein